MSRSESVNATYDGVVRFPWSFAMISTRSFCQTPTQLHEHTFAGVLRNEFLYLYVVPRSIPTGGASLDMFVGFVGFLKDKGSQRFHMTRDHRQAFKPQVEHARRF